MGDPDPRRGLPDTPPAGDVTSGLEATVVREREVAKTFGRFRDLRLLGAGGMGTVYRAFDPDRNVWVALKLIPAGDVGLAQRLLAEARAQSRIDHANVCRIYEAGEDTAGPYIAMQLVPGVTLRDLHKTLTLEEKLRIVQRVAEAVHAAHRVGLVHRDIKPSNVMVETTSTGERIPYVLDFGLAREVASAGMTLSGAVLGTPWYMSPEQARGEGRALDRRTDVYSLGATLYDLVAGHPPFEGETGVDVLVRVVTEDPVPLAVRAPSVPRDVAVIAMKCLEKDPARRYDSARALAEDIGRYLDGAPIQARPTGVLARVARRARKNRGVVIAAGVAALAVAVSLGVAVRARIAARAQAALAAEFARTVEDSGWILRTAHLAPLHDVRPERARVRERLGQIAERMRTGGEAARGPGEYALGRGALILGDPKTARRHLEAAEAAGYRTPELAYSLGLALGALYRRELDTADGIGNPALREARRAEIQKAYRDPAVRRLREGARSDLAPAPYVEALLAFYERRHEEALRGAAAARAGAPWLYEAALLEGDVHARLSRERHETGDAAGSRTALVAAEERYRAAADYARSDPAARDGLCQTYLQRMEWVVYTGADFTPLYAQARAACDEVLVVDPDRADTHSRLANIHRYWANGLSGRGVDPIAALDQAAAHATRSIELDPDNRRGHGNLGIVYRLRAAWEGQHGVDPFPSLGRALQSLGRAAELVPDAGAFNDLGNAYVTRAGASRDRGLDPRADLQEALARYDRALQLVPDYAYAHANRGLAATDLARYETKHGLDPAKALAEARGSLERAVALLPHLEGTHTRLADALVAAAEWRVGRGDDPQGELAAARRELGEARRLNPRPGPDIVVLGGVVDLVDARHRLARGQPAAEPLRAAIAAFREAKARDPKLQSAQRRLEEAEALRTKASRS
jgi:eukaryotic-like serine/threonine-protein kinase